MSDAATDLLGEYEGFESDGGVAPIARDVVAVTGPDAGRYLQGQLSQEVVALADGASTWSLILQPTGKVDAWLRVTRRSDEDYVLDVDAGWGEALVARLNRFLLRTKAEIGAPRTVHGFAFRAGIGAAAPIDAVDPGGPVLDLPVVGPGVVGSDSFGLDASVMVGAAPIGGAEPVSAATLERYRIAHAVPAMGAELTSETIPAEAGQWLVDASVSFTKGCYTGQELVARIDSRGGNVPRPIRSIVVEGGSTPSIGGEVRCEGAPVGVVTSATSWLAHHQPALALAPLARSVAVGAAVEVETDTGLAPGIVTEPPFVGHGAD